MTEQTQINGYRALTAQEIAAINYVKTAANDIGAMLAEMRGFPGIDQRWLAIGSTDLQRGFMALTRAIAKPEGF